MKPDIDAGTRVLFDVDAEFSRDRAQYGEFDRMPPALQQWWRERFIRKMEEVSRIGEQGRTA